MSIYDNETTSKIYPDLNPTAPQEQQTYQLKKLTEIEAYLVDDIEVRERIAKKMKRFNTITSIVLHENLLKPLSQSKNNTMPLSCLPKAS